MTSACPYKSGVRISESDSSLPAGRPVEKRRMAHTLRCGDDEDAASGESDRRGVRHDLQDTPLVAPPVLAAGG
jgi:hypothetical protein